MGTLFGRGAQKAWPKVKYRKNHEFLGALFCGNGPRLTSLRLGISLSDARRMTEVGFFFLEVRLLGSSERGPKKRRRPEMYFLCQIEKTGRKYQ